VFKDALICPFVIDSMAPGAVMAVVLAVRSAADLAKEPGRPGISRNAPAPISSRTIWLPCNPGSYL
jgi:hypothetical protein